MTLPVASSIDSGVLRVLHVEDSELDHLMVQAMLEQAGLQVTWLRVETLADFVSALEQTWDAIICDYRLPSASGLDMLRYLREGGQPIPFLLVSGEIGEETAVAAMREGAADYLLKTHLKRLAPALLQAIKAAEAQRQRAVADAALRESQRQLQALTRHLQARVEAERAAMARELHDDVGSALTALKFDLAWLARHGQDEAMVSRAQRASSTLDLAIEASRRLMLNLRPPILQEGLPAALQWLVQHFERQHEALQVRLTMTASHLALSEDLALVAYRFVQEALHNVSKHARARLVSVDLAVAGGVLTLDVRDDGVGMNVVRGPREGGFGLRGLQERAAAVGGWVDISSRLGAGTQLLLSLPLHGTCDTEDADADWLEEAR
jgi:signal transduction histidine kinase